ncbi:MAG: hypothetical protein BMS9Abin26_0368 [Gammaproteobacteria bacterium]|nr:MAG: hypothetical protein BMS9Abin26_0368 [Gammaproteobacteria bacterium]
MKIIKFFTWFIGILVFLVLALAIALPLLFDLNDFKDTIASQVQERTGRELKIDGDLSLTFFPWVGIETGAMQLSNASGFGDKAFARFSSANIRVKLLPLLRKQVEMDTITLKGLDLNLVRKIDGRTNWDDLLALAGDRAATEPGAKAEGGDPKVLLAALAINGLDIQNANITWDDKLARQRFSISRFNMVTGGLTLGEAVDIEGGFHLLSSAPKLVGNIKIKATINANPMAAQVRLENAILSVDLRDSKGRPVNLNLTADIDADMIQNSIVLEGMTLNASAHVNEAPSKLTIKAGIVADLNKQIISMDKMTLNADTVLNKQPLTVSLQGSVTANLGTTVVTVKHMKLDANTRFNQKPTRLTVHGHAVANLAKQAVSISDLKLGINDLKASGKLSIQNITTLPQIDGQLVIAEFNPRSVLPGLGIQLPQTSDKNVLQKAAAALQISGNPTRIRIRKMVAQLDDSRISGDLTINNPSKPRYVLNLNLDKIDVDRYLPPKSAAGTAATPGFELISGAHAAVSSALLPVEALRNLDLTGKFNLGQLKVMNLLSQQSSVDIRARNGLLKISPIKTRMYEGRFNGNVTIDATTARGDAPVMTMNSSFTGINVGRLLQDFAGEAALTGTGDITITSLTASLATAEGLRQSIKGTASMNIRNGVIKGINQIGELQQGLMQYRSYTNTRLKGKSYSEDTPFDRITAYFSIRNGIAYNDNLVLLAQDLSMCGKGEVNLVTQRLKYDAKTVLGDNLHITGLKKSEIDNFRRVPIKTSIRCPITRIGKECIKNKFDDVIGKMIAKEIDLELPPYDVTKGCKDQNYGRLVEKALTKKIQRGLLDKLLKKKRSSTTQSGTTSGGSSQPAQKSRSSKEKLEDKLRDAFKGLFK